MAYRIRRSSEPSAEIRRVLTQQNQKAQQLLANWEQDPARHVHRARQHFKRIRALMWLLKRRYRYVYHVENRAYRDLGRRLAYTRDASAMVEAADRLAERIWEPGPRQSLMMVRKSLAAQAERELAQALAGMSDAVAVVRAELPLLAERITGLPLGSLRRKHLRRGARATLKRAHRDYRGIGMNSAAERYHDWRKHTKYAWYQTSLMAELMPKWSHEMREPLGELAALLGNAQDLAVLRSLLASQPDALGIDIHWQRLRKIVADVQRESHLQAIVLGRQLFEARGAEQPAAVLEWPLQSRRA